MGDTSHRILLHGFRRQKRARWKTLRRPFNLQFLLLLMTVVAIICFAVPPLFEFVLVKHVNELDVSRPPEFYEALAAEEGSLSGHPDATVYRNEEIQGGSHGFVPG